MSLEDESAPLEPRNASSPEAGPEQKMLDLLAASCPEQAKPAAPEGIEVAESNKVAKQEPQRKEMPPALADHAPELLESTPLALTQSGSEQEFVGSP